MDIASAIVNLLGGLSSIITIGEFLLKIRRRFARPSCRARARLNARADERGFEVSVEIDITLD